MSEAYPYPPRAPLELNRREEKGAALAALPFLRETGWIKSHLMRSPVNAEGCPIPWYRYAAIDFFYERVSGGHLVFEFGSGNSTHWWARMAKQVTAVEHDEVWARKVRADAAENVEILEVGLKPGGEYCRTPERTGDLYDIMIIDGRDRVNCAMNCLESLKSSGVVIWDDSHRSRYRNGIAFLVENGFRQLRFTGLGPIAPNPGETSVFYRTANCFGI